jgi:hypothetical protein
VQQWASPRTPGTMAAAAVAVAPPRMLADVAPRHDGPGEGGMPPQPLLSPARRASNKGPPTPAATAEDTPVRQRLLKRYGDAFVKVPVPWHMYPCLTGTMSRSQLAPAYPPPRTNAAHAKRQASLSRLRWRRMGVHGPCLGRGCPP